MKLNVEAEVRAAVKWLRSKGTQHDREGMARFGIVSNKVFGVSVANVRALAKGLGRNHALAAELWKTEWLEARILAAFVEEPARVTPAQMDRWCRDFDNWAICDALCIHLFDRTPYAWEKVEQWSAHPSEFVRRAAFALIASLATHDKKSGDEPFVHSLALIEVAGADGRNYVKKAVSWALRRVGGRNPALYAAAIELAQRLVNSPDAAARWVGKDAMREFIRKGK